MLTIQSHSKHIFKCDICKQRYKNIIEIPYLANMYLSRCIECYTIELKLSFEIKLLENMLNCNFTSYEKIIKLWHKKQDSLWNLGKETK